MINSRIRINESNEKRDIREEKLAGVERFELPTVGFGDRCSTNWNYTPATETNYTQAKSKVKHNVINIICSLNKSTLSSYFNRNRLLFNLFGREHITKAQLVWVWIYVAVYFIF